MSTLILRNSEGEIIKEIPFDKNQTNEEWAKSLDLEHFAKLLYDAMLYGQQCDKDDVTCEECGCPWCKTDSISEWLKQPHR